MTKHTIDIEWCQQGMIHSFKSIDLILGQGDCL